MNQNGQTAAVKRNKNNRSSGGVSSNSSSMSSNVQRTINRSMRNNYPNIRSGSNDGSNISSSSSIGRNIHQSSKSSQSMIMMPQTSGSNSNHHHHSHQSHNHMANSTIEDDLPTNSGVYKNKRLVHTMTALVGCLIEVRLNNGKRYEGILKTFSSDFQLALNAATLIDNVDEDKRCQSSNSSSGSNIGNLLAALECDENVVETLVISPKNLVTFKALEVDMDFATKKAVMTDSEIAKNDGTTKQQRELVPWDDGEDGLDGNESMILDSLEDHSGLSLGSGVTNGWKTEDMFKLNESKYNIETTYQEDMSEYTIKLEHRNDDEYRQREAQAAKIAREIEQDTARLERYAKEDEVDEETRYSAVIRGDSDSVESGNNNATPNNNNNHHHHYRNDMNHHQSRDQPDRNRDNNLRNSNSGDNLSGFRTQNSRQNRNRMNRGNDRSSGGPSLGSNDSNWRERVNTNHRYHQQSQQQQMPYGSTQNAHKPNSNYIDRRYNAINSQPPPQAVSSQQQQPQQSYQSSSAASQVNNNKISYSSVSARSVSNEMIAPSSSSNVEAETGKTFSRNSGQQQQQHNQPSNDTDNNNMVYQRKSSTGSNITSLPQRESFKQQRTPYNRVVEQQQQHHHHHHYSQQQHPHSVQQSHSESKISSNSAKSLDSSEVSSSAKSSLPTSPSSGTPSNISTPTAESSSLLKSPLAATNLPSKPVDIYHSKSSDSQQQQQQARITSPKHGLENVNNNNRKSIDSSATGENRPTMVDAVKKGVNINQQQQQSPRKSMMSPTKDLSNSNEPKKDSISSSSSSLNNVTTVSNPITTTSVSLTTAVTANEASTSSSPASSITSAQQQQPPQPSTSASTPPLSNDANELVVTSKLNPNAKVFTPRAVHLPNTTPPQQSTQQQVVTPVQPINYAAPHVPYSPVAAGHMSATTPPSIPPTPSLTGPSGTIVPNGQFISYAHPGSAAAPGPHITGHAAHHAQQQPLRYQIPFQYNPMMPQMVPQYIAIQHFATSMPTGAVTATAPPTAVVASQSSNVPNQPPPPGSSHHMIATNAQSMATQANAANSLVQNNGPQAQGPVQQSQQPVNQSQPRGHYRKGGIGGNSNNNQQPQQQQMIRHHEPFVSQQQAQVANVTGQPIMTGATQPQHLPVVFPAQPVHHHHHTQNQIHHGQPGGQNAAVAAQLAASGQPGPHNQALHYMYSAGFPHRPLLAAHQAHHHHPNALNMTIQSGLYPPPDAHMPTIYMQTEMPPPHQIVTAQSMAPPPNAMVPPPATNIPQTIVSVPTSVGPAGTVGVVSSNQSAPPPQGSAPTSQQQPTFG